MRVDLAMKYLCLARSRSLAKHLCDDGRVAVNGTMARAAGRVSVGDRLCIHFEHTLLDIELLRVPPKQLSKTAAADCYRVIERRPLEPKRDIVDGI
jgi:ribosomal 50S subunit-recycling heat shock protein